MSFTVSVPASFCCVTKSPNIYKLTLTTLYLARDSVDHGFGLDSAGVANAYTGSFQASGELLV